MIPQFEELSFTNVPGTVQSASSISFNRSAMAPCNDTTFDGVDLKIVETNTAPMVLVPTW